MKRILDQQLYGKRGGLHFTNTDPVIGMPRQGVYSGISGEHLLNLTANVNVFNKAIKGWGNSVAGKLRETVRGRFTKGKKEERKYLKGIHAGKSEGKLVNSIRAKYGKERGGQRIERIGFNLERHGVFLQKGVGRGYVMQGGSVARIAKSDEARRYRFQSNWFNQTLDNNVNELSNIIVHHVGDAIVLNTKRMFIQ
jgi:hypothetical protein